MKLKRLLRRHWLASVGIVIILAVIAMALFAPYLAPRSPLKQDIMLRLKPPGSVDLRASQTLWLGSDHLGRDVLSRIIYGSRISLIVSLSAVVASAAIGLILGLLAGFYRGWVESVIMRLVDLQMAFPFILLALAIVALLGPSLGNIIIVFAVTAWPVYSRTIRGMVLTYQEREFIQAARALGASDLRLMFLHLLPNLVSPMLVLASFEVARMILLESALSFLGLGVRPPTPTWGSMLADGRDYIRDAWWIAAFPGLAIMVTAAGINFLGDGLRDWFDPTLEHTK